MGDDRLRIDEEIRRLETQRAEFERQLKTQTASNLRTLYNHIAAMDRTLVSLRQERARRGYQ